jgi:EamA domain-containing membrane protein RarD
MIYSGAVGQTFLQYSEKGYLWILLGGCTDTLACITNVVAFQNDSSSFIGLMTFTGVVYAFLADVFIFKSSMLGSQLVFAVAILLITIFMAIYKLRISLNTE